VLQREWMVDERRTRPKDRMIGHTGFITVAKKIAPLCAAPEEPEALIEGVTEMPVAEGTAP
jgi:hypothetical protein